MKEQCYAIGQTPRLIGVYTFADCENANLSSKEKPTVLLLNSGLINRTGPFRHYVRLARAFAKQGFNTFRFDLSGIGDSERRTDNRSHDEHAIDDVSDVMSFLELQHGDKEFIVMGICTGADNAHKAMVNHKNVVGAVSIDGYSYPTLKYYLKLYGKKLFRLASWLTMIRLALKNFVDLLKPKEEENIFESFDFEWLLPNKAKTELDYQNFINRDAHLLSIFTASWPYNYEQQLADSLPNIEFGENIQMVYLENAEHTFPLVDDRVQLTETIINWLNRSFA